MLSGLALGIFFSYPGNAIDGKGIAAPLQPDWGPPLRGGWEGGGELGNHMGRGSVVAKRVLRGGGGKSNSFIFN